MRKLFSLFLALLATTTLWAYDFHVGELYYNITSSSAPYTVEVTDAVSSITTATIPENVTYDGTTYSVTSIGDDAFEWCISLASIAIPNSVTSIGNSAFYYCFSLTSITIPNSVTSIGDEAFWNCSSLTSITVPNSVTSIGDRAFEDCSSLTSMFVEDDNTTYDSRDNCNAIIETATNTLIAGCQNTIIPNSVTSIGEWAFAGCSSLTSITIPNSVTSIGDYAFRYCDSLTSITISNSVKSIGNFTFDGCASLTSITIPNSVTSIGGSAFEGCSSLTSVNIPNSVTSIGDYAFRYCDSLTSPVYNTHCFAYLPTSFEGTYAVPDGIKQIAGGAFWNCSSLTSITIPNSVTSIGRSAFANCSSLTSIVVESGNATYDSRENCNAIIETATNTLIAGCQNTVIPNSVTSIGGSAFRGCSSLATITIPNSVTSIGKNAFYDCDSLTTVTIGNSVTTIGEYAFEYCSSIDTVVWNAKNCADFEWHSAPFRDNSDSIISFSFGDSVEHIPANLCRDMKNLEFLTIPESVTSIGESAFYGCSSLASITIPHSVTSIGESAFYGCSSLASITIPHSVTSIGDLAFCGCSSITSLTLGNNLTTIGSYAFSSLNALTSVTQKAPSIEAYCQGQVSKLLYDSASLNDDAIRTIEINGEEVTDWVIPSSITKIEDYTFYNCPSITSVALPNTITSIGKSAFGNCTSITAISIPNKVTRIGARAFSKCPITDVIIPNNVTNIGGSAFSNCDKLSSLILGESVDSIGGGAFYGCRKLYDIYCYAPEPPYAIASGWSPSFENFNVNLYVPCDNLKAFQMDPVFGTFKYIHCIDSEDVPAEGVIITPGFTDVTITWPTDDDADNYIIVIEKDGEVFCTLTFNAEGQLLNIAFAPGRDGNHPAQYAEQAGKGYRFTVTGLEEGTHYTYNIDVKNTANQTINSHSGEFTTQSTTAVDNITTNNANSQKIIRDGQFIILRDGIEYNAIGQEL